MREGTELSFNKIMKTENSGIEETSKDQSVYPTALQILIDSSNKIFHGTFPQYLDDFLMITFVGGCLCVLLWRFLQASFRTCKNLVRFSRISDRFRSRGNWEMLASPLLHSAQRAATPNRPEVEPEISDARAAGDSLERTMIGDRGGRPRIMVMFLHSGQENNEQQGNDNGNQRTVQGIILAQDIFEEMRRTQQRSGALQEGDDDVVGEVDEMQGSSTNDLNGEQVATGSNLIQVPASVETGCDANVAIAPNQLDILSEAAEVDVATNASQSLNDIMLAASSHSLISQRQSNSMKDLSLNNSAARLDRFE